MMTTSWRAGWLTPSCVGALSIHCKHTGRPRTELGCQVGTVLLMARTSSTIVQVSFNVTQCGSGRRGVDRNTDGTNNPFQDMIDLFISDLLWKQNWIKTTLLGPFPIEAIDVGGSTPNLVANIIRPLRMLHEPANLKTLTSVRFYFLSTCLHMLQ